MTTELIPSIPKELLSIVYFGISRGWLATSPGSAQSGSRSSKLMVAWQTRSWKAPRFPANSGRQRSHGVPDEALGIVEKGRRTPVEDFSQGLAFLRISTASAGGVSADNIDLVGGEPSTPQSNFNTFPLSLGVGKDEVGGVGIDGVGDDFGDRLCISGLGVRKVAPRCRCRLLRRRRSHCVLCRRDGMPWSDRCD